MTTDTRGWLLSSIRRTLGNPGARPARYQPGRSRRTGRGARQPWAKHTPTRLHALRFGGLKRAGWSTLPTLALYVAGCFAVGACFDRFGDGPVYPYFSTEWCLCLGGGLLGIEAAQLVARAIRQVRSRTNTRLPSDDLERVYAQPLLSLKRLAPGPPSPGGRMGAWRRRGELRFGPSGLCLRLGWHERWVDYAALRRAEGEVEAITLELSDGERWRCQTSRLPRGLMGSIHFANLEQELRGATLASIAYNEELAERLRRRMRQRLAEQTPPTLRTGESRA